MPDMAEEEESIELPPGFRFHPTDEEIITHYLIPKVADPAGFIAAAMGEVDLNKCEPWDLPSKARMEEKKKTKEWYFFCHRDRKYPTGTRTNRATGAGFWKATGKDKEIFRGRGVLVGTRKTLVFYRGRAPKGEKTNWVMHEYRLEASAAAAFSNHPKPAKEEWVVCRVILKEGGADQQASSNSQSCSHMMSYFGNGFNQLPPLMDFNPPLTFSNKEYQGVDFAAMTSKENNPVSYYSQPAVEPAQYCSSYLQQGSSSAMRSYYDQTLEQPEAAPPATDHNTAEISSVLDLENVWFKLY